MTDDEARETLERLIPRDSTVYVILRSVSKSGMSREIGLVSFVDGHPYHPNYAAARLLDRSVNKAGDGIRCQGAGMDMGFELVYSLAQKLYGDGYALKHVWL
jgi:hypothetical protein